MEEVREDFKKSYYAVIPASIRYSKKITDGAKLLYGEITALCNDRGYCWASNDYFAELYNNKPRTISRWVASLVKSDFIYIDNKKGNRKIFLAENNLPNLDIEEKEQEPPKKIKKPKKEKSKVEKKATHKFTEDDLRLAETLRAKIIYNFPALENQKINISEWADDIRKLREIDNPGDDKILEKINFMIIWLQGGELKIPGKPIRIFEPHNFWSKNILSASKLRQQWFKNLVPQLQEEIKKIAKTNTPTQL